MIMHTACVKINFAKIVRSKLEHLFSSKVALLRFVKSRNKQAWLRTKTYHARSVRTVRGGVSYPGCLSLRTSLRNVTLEEAIEYGNV